MEFYLERIKRLFSKNKISQRSVIDGKSAEAYALDYLCTQKLVFVEKNYRCRGGEIDLIMLDDSDLVFIEVKFRSYSGYGTAAEMVSVAKQRKIIHATQVFLANHTKYANFNCRFDVFAIEGKQKETMNVSWIKNAFLS